METNLLESYITDTLSDLARDNLLRSPPTVEGAQGRLISIGGREYINAASNNTLSLANHPLLQEAAIDAVRQYGSGGGASRLVCGELTIHRQLEERIAKFKNCEDAVVFSSGYMANVGTISALADENTVVLPDKLCHASIIDGVRLSGAYMRTYPHCDVDRLEALLKKHSGKKILVITDSVFSMDGDIAPLPEIVRLCEKYSAMLMVDEAHATGVLGAGGRGAAEMFGLEGRIPVLMGTLSKALGSMGGFVAGSRELVSFIKNRARSYIYTTSPVPSAMGAALAALEFVENNPQTAQPALVCAKLLWGKLSGMGYSCGCPTLPGGSLPVCQSHILPVVVGSVEDTLALSKRLFASGVFAPAIRPPTVRPGTSRIRLSLMNTHTEADIQRIADAFAGA